MVVFHYQIPVSNFAVCANMSSGSMERGGIGAVAVAGVLLRDM